MCNALILPRISVQADVFLTSENEPTKAVVVVAWDKGFAQVRNLFNVINFFEGLFIQNFVVVNLWLQFGIPAHRTLLC